MLDIEFVDEKRFGVAIKAGLLQTVDEFRLLGGIDAAASDRCGNCPLSIKRGRPVRNCLGLET